MKVYQGLRQRLFRARQLLAELVQGTANQSSLINEKLGAVIAGLDNQSSLINDKLGAVIAGLDNQSGLISDKLGAAVAALDNQPGLISDKLGAAVAGLDNQSGLINDKLGAVVAGLDNQSGLINDKLGAVVAGLNNQSSLINDKLGAVVGRQDAQLAIQQAQIEIIDRMMQSVSADVRRLADLAEIQARRAALQNRSKIYICHSGHEDDRTYTENVTEYLEARGIECKILELNSSGQRPELQQCLDDQPIAVLGFNSQLDHSWLPTGSFLAAAAGRKVPVIQWILDDLSALWPEFKTSTPVNSRFLLNTKFAQQYFHQFCMPDALTDTIGGVGPSKRSRIGALSRDSFLSRPIKCLIPISFKRNGRTIADTEAAIAALDDPLATAVREAHASAMLDLMQPLRVHLIAALEKLHRTVPDHTFNSCFQLIEELVQRSRRRKIFEVARNYPVLVQSDETATRYFQGAVATFAENVGMQSTMTRMQSSAAVLSVSPLNDLIHDRTMNGLNAGCANLIEDNLAHRGVFQHGKNALLFRYEDDSLQECLDIVCNQPERAYSIAMSGIALRDAVPFVNCCFHAILDLARR
jgi:hypothetical protein